MLKRTLVRLLALSLAVFGAHAAAAEPLKIGITLHPYYSFVANIVKDRAEIIPDQRIRGVPDLIAEVLSPTNPEQDTVVKRAAYARAGVPEYWIVRPATRDVLLCWQPDATLGDYTQSRLVAADAELVSPTLTLRVPVGDLFSGAPNADL